MDVSLCPQCNSQLSTRAKRCHVCGFDRDSSNAVDAVVDTARAAIAGRGEGAIETCANCGRAIGKLEAPCVDHGHVVCHECKQRLETQRTPMQPRSVVLSPSLMPDGSASASTVWRNLRWLGFFMFVLGVFIHPVIGVVGLVLWLVAGVVWMSTKTR